MTRAEYGDAEKTSIFSMLGSLLGIFALQPGFLQTAASGASLLRFDEAVTTEATFVSPSSESPP